MRPIKVVGAGFSGLTTAYHLVKAGRKVQVLEKQSRAGGLIKTVRTEHGLVETAANGILNSARFESMCRDIGVPLLPTRNDGRKRFIYRGRPRRLPLNFLDVVRLGFSLIKSSLSLRPRPFETISQWGRRVLGNATTDYLLTPALGGIYAGDSNRLSASLIFGRAELAAHLQTYRPTKAKMGGTVAPQKGMQQLIDGLQSYLENAGVEFIFNHQPKLQPTGPTIVCLSAREASEYLAGAVPELSDALRQIEMLSLVTATCFFDRGAARLKGFGCLFPLNQGFRARGVLFNDCIFEERGPAHAETWILGGALDPDIVNLNDNELRETICNDRERFYGRTDQPLEIHLTRWPQTLPHYSVDLERVLKTMPAPPLNIALVGNYLGRIGLAKILERAAFVVDHFPTLA